MPPSWELPNFPMPGWAGGGDGPTSPDWSKVTAEEWRLRAMAAAGIDPTQWDPSQGFEANRDNIQKVYALYAKWYLDNPDLKWAGMAKLAGGSVYGGLESMKGERAWGGWWFVGLIPGVYSEVKNSQMDKVERIFVTMQKDIFMDLGWQHQAYVEGGLPAVKAAFDRGDMSRANYDAWVQIATGSEAEKWEGNATLLKREQSEILPPGYDRIRDMWFGGTISGQISDNTASPIPGGATFRELYPDGDVTVFEDRWRWIEGHMLPEYKALGAEYTKTLVSQPLEELAKREFAPRP